MVHQTMEVVTWKDIRRAILELNPSIGREIDNLPNSGNFKFIRARVPYGAAIEHGQGLKFTIDGKPVDFASGEMPKSIKDLLDYSWSGIPVSIMTHNTIESFINLPTHVIPLRVIRPGTAFSLYSIFDKAQTTHIMHGAYSSCGGARSLIMLPKISHAQYNERIARAYDLPDEHLCPKNLNQQWFLFNDICNSKQFRAEADWHCEFIMFTKEVMGYLDKALTFKYALLKQIWNYTSFARNQAMYDLVWSVFTENLTSAVRNTPFIVETVKHLIKLALREVPGFSPVVNEEQGPIKKLTEVFLDTYRIRYYLPIFMTPKFYDGRSPVYYSLHKHTFFHTIPQRSNANRTIDEMCMIKKLVTSFKDRVLNNEFPFNLDDTVLYQALQEVEFEFYHPQANDRLNTDINSIAKEDRRFMTMLQGFEIQKDLNFPDHSIFFNGCVRIRPSKRDKPKPSMRDFLMPMIDKKNQQY